MGPTTPTQVYYVRSDRDPNRFYLVAENPRGYLECDCKAAQFRRDRPCKHTKRVVSGEVRPAAVKAAAPPASPSLVGKGGTSLRREHITAAADLWGDPDLIDRAVRRARGAA